MHHRDNNVRFYGAEGNEKQRKENKRKEKKRKEKKRKEKKRKRVIQHHTSVTISCMGFASSKLHHLFFPATGLETFAKWVQLPLPPTPSC